MATKQDRRDANALVGGLEERLFRGSPPNMSEITQAREFLVARAFSPQSDYFARLDAVKTRQVQHSHSTSPSAEKLNFGGPVGSGQIQLQSIYDHHVILSSCYDGHFRSQYARIKLSHRFNSEGRIDFVQMKFLTSFDRRLNGECRDLLTVEGYKNTDDNNSGLRKNWQQAPAFYLKVLPIELIALSEEVYHVPKSDLLTWLINFGHTTIDDSLTYLRQHKVELDMEKAAETRMRRNDRSQHQNNWRNYTYAGYGNHVGNYSVNGVTDESTVHSRPDSRMNSRMVQTRPPEPRREYNHPRRDSYAEQKPVISVLKYPGTVGIMEKIAKMQAIFDVNTPESGIITYQLKSN